MAYDVQQFLHRFGKNVETPLFDPTPFSFSVKDHRRPQKMEKLD